MAFDLSSVSCTDRKCIGLPAESQIQELFCSSVKFDHKISISDGGQCWSNLDNVVTE